MNAVPLSVVGGSMSFDGSWAEANQACLVREFAQLRSKLDAAAAGATHPDRALELNPSPERLRDALQPPPAIDQLSATFGLSAFERETLLLCAGIEMDSALAALCALALGRDRPGSISFSLALGVLGDPHWSALAPSAPLRRFHLVELESGQGLTTAALRIDERILHFLVGANDLDPRLESLLRTRDDPGWMADEHAAVAAEACLAWRSDDATNAPVLNLFGDDPRGQEDVAASIAQRLRRRAYILTLDSIPAPEPGGATADAAISDVTQFIGLWTREAALLPALLVLQCQGGALKAASRQMVERLPAPLIVASREPVRMTRRSVRYAVDKPLPMSQKRLWAKALGVADGGTAIVDGASVTTGGETSDLVEALAQQFRLSAEQIGAAGLAAVGASDDRRPDPDRLWKTCRALSRPRLEDMAERIQPLAGWDDLILPDGQKRMLRQLAAQARHRMTVHEAWGFAARGQRGLGVSALFAGPSGTGKTLAAEVIACALRLDLYRIDLSSVVSKYLGETEKNLSQVFDAAEEGGVLLLFDEADALFGKRGEVKDSHDRYANIEVGYLLQRMETFQGLAILTTNLKASLDRAFQRRLRFIVDFPFPGPDEREAIWRRAFPPLTPTRDLDWKRLAQLNMTGGSIRNIVLNAAFLAAEEGPPVRMEHLLTATRAEALKIERPLSDAEIRGWA